LHHIVKLSSKNTAVGAMADFAGSGKSLTQEGLESSLNAMRLDVAEVWAVISVETTGCGFLIDRRPKILFERHVLSRLTGGRYDADAPDISASTAGGMEQAEPISTIGLLRGIRSCPQWRHF